MAIMAEVHSHGDHGGIMGQLADEWARVLHCMQDNHGDRGVPSMAIMVVPDMG
jgi:hypothetical protein